MRRRKQKPHVALVPTPGMGHLIPLTEFGKRLHLHHGFSVTFLIPTDGSPMKSERTFLEALPETIHVIYLPQVSFDDLSDDVKAESRIALTLTRSLPNLHDSIRVLAESTHLTALVVDVFGTDAFEVARDFGVSRYIFFPTNAMMLSFVFYFPNLDKTCTCEFRDLTEPVKIPGCPPVHGRDLPDPVQDRNNEAYKWILHHSKRYNLADGIMVNSFLDLEPGAFNVLTEENSGKPPIYPVGPLIQTGSVNEDHNGYECLRWLDKHPTGSVLFVSFGSGGTLSLEQLTELALGLEMSGQRFIWVVRSPHEKASNATYFGLQSVVDPFEFLPNGFMERTRGIGLFLQSWAPQIQILGHRSTGGFLTHCGWNSILESVVHGVPLMAWPLYAEQKMNAVLLTNELKVALRVENRDE